MATTETKAAHAESAVKPKSLKQSYPILIPFRLNGQWWRPAIDKTISLLPTQASMLLMDGKIGKPGSTAVATKTATKTEDK